MTHFYYKVDNLLAIKQLPSIDETSASNEALFTIIAKDIESQGYSIRPAALPEELALSLLCYLLQFSAAERANFGVPSCGWQQPLGYPWWLWWLELPCEPEVTEFAVCW